MICLAVICVGLSALIVSLILYIALCEIEKLQARVTALEAKKEEEKK